LATDKPQAQIIKRYTQSYFAKVPLLQPLVEREVADGLDLSTGAELLILASNFRSVRGRSIACVILDEVAFWQSELTANPDVEVYAALVPSLATLPGSMLIGISTPYRRAGLLWQKHRDHYARTMTMCWWYGGRAEPSIRACLRRSFRTLSSAIQPRRKQSGWESGAMTLPLS
jgi:hypothetical protein